MSSVTADTAWNDLFVRTAQGETSPTGRVGGVSSPDIIPWGVQPVNPATFTTEASYKDYVSNKPFLSGQTNYIYVRAKNSSATTDAVGKAYLCLTNPAVVLWPGGDKWTFIKTSRGMDASPLGPVGPGGIAVTDDPFAYVPLDSGHRCLVTWLSTKSHPVKGPPPEIRTSEELVTFLRANPNYAHHNIDIAPNTTGAFSFPAPFSTGTGSSSWMVGLRVRNCKGFTVSFSCPDALPDGSYIDFQPTTVTMNEETRYMLGPFELDENWNINVNCTYHTNNLQPDNFSVELITQSVVNSFADQSLLAFATPVTAEFGLDMEKINALGLLQVPVGSLGVMKGANPA